MKKELTDKIIDLITDKHGRSGNSDIYKEHALALSYPSGEIAYFKQRIFDLKKQIAVDSQFGKIWVENYCHYEDTWIQACAEIALKQMNEKEVIQDIQKFVKPYHLLMKLESRILEIESFENKVVHEELTLQEKALIAVFENEIITRDQGGLYNWYTYYSIRANRIGTGTEKKTQNKITRFEKIIPYLSGPAQKAAVDELNTLKAAFDKDTF